jgi:hypothetical protein
MARGVSAPERLRSERWIVWILACLVTLPSLLLTFPMGPDLGMHYYAISALRHYGNTAMFPEHLVELNLGHPNQLFFLLTAALGWFVPLMLAVKLTVAMNSALFVLGVARLLRYLNRTAWVLLPLTPVVLGMAYYVGLQANQLANGLLFAALVELDKFAHSPTKRSLAAVLGWTAVLYFAHQQAQVYYSCIALMFAVAQWGSRRQFFFRIVPFATGVTLTLAQLWAQNAMLVASAISDRGAVFMPFRSRLGRLPFNLVGAQTDAALLAFPIMLAVAIAVLGVYRAREGAFRWEGVRTALWRYRYEALAAISLALYFLGPNCINTANYVAERFLPWSAVFAFVAVSPKSMAVPRVVRVGLGLYAAGYGVAIVPAHLEVEENIQQILRVAEYVKPGSAIAMLDGDVEEPNKPFTMVAGDALIAAERGGRPLHSFMYASISPVRFTPNALWKDAMMRMLSPKVLNFLPKLDFTAFRYVLLKSQTVAKNQLFARLLEPEGRFVVSTGRWTLIESRLPVRPLTEPFGRPNYSGDSLGDRLRGVLDVMNERDWLESGKQMGGACTVHGGVVGQEILEIRQFFERSDREAAKRSSAPGEGSGGAPQEKSAPSMAGVP